ncbi:MAG TPA: hypothetical protein VMU88_01895 [bacterium]|nr:hypothetical protein [bacterium]
MNWKQWTGIFLLSTMPSLALAQDARSFAIGGAAVGGFNGPFSIYWNPAGLTPMTSGTSPWSFSTGYSALNSSNSGSPILRFNSSAALASGQDPVSQRLEDLGLVAVQYLSYGGGVLYDHTQDSVESHDAYQFFADQQSGAITLSSGTTYNLNEQQTTQDVETLILSYSTQLPLTSFKFVSAGFSLKYHYGTQFSQTALSGSFIQGSGGPVTYTKTTSTSGLGLSTDAGLLAKVTDGLQVGVLFQNLTSSFNWTAQQQSYALDPSTGAEAVTATQSVTISAPFPYTVKVGILAAPSDSDTFVDAEADFAKGQPTRWKVGIERFYPANNLVVRLGTFADPVSGDQLWAIGAGFATNQFSLNGAFITRSLPNLEDSVALGGALDATVRF